MASDEIKIFCENVKQLRKIHNLTKKEMAEKIGISVRSLRMLEDGVLPKRLHAEVVMEICDHFHITPNDLFAERGVDTAPSRKNTHLD